MTGFVEVLEAARNGAPWAIGELWRAHQPALLRYLRAGNPSAAEDIASDVWVEVARGMAKFRGGEPQFRGYLFTIARHRLIDERRKAAGRRTEPVAGFPDEPSMDDAIAQAIDALSPDGAMAVLHTLPTDQAEAILLRVVAGLDVAQVARIMGRRPGTVRVLAHRGLRTLAQRLAPASVSPALGEGHEKISERSARQL